MRYLKFISWQVKKAEENFKFNTTTRVSSYIVIIVIIIIIIVILIDVGKLLLQQSFTAITNHLNGQGRAVQARNDVNTTSDQKSLLLRSTAFGIKSFNCDFTSFFKSSTTYHGEARSLLLKNSIFTTHVVD